MIYVLYEDYGYQYESSYGGIIGYTTDKERAHSIAKEMNDAYAEYLLKFPEIDSQLDVLLEQSEESGDWVAYDNEHARLLASINHRHEYDFDYYSVYVSEVEEIQ